MLEGMVCGRGPQTGEPPKAEGMAEEEGGKGGTAPATRPVPAYAPRTDVAEGEDGIVW